MYSLDGQGDDLDFFANAFTTHVDPPKRTLLKILAFFFHRSIPYISSNSDDRPVDESFIPLIESASVCADGIVVQHPNAPSKLLFLPKTKLETTTDVDFRTAIVGNIKAPTDLYDIYDEDNLLLGTLKLTDDFVASSHGDNMHFKHQRISKLSSGKKCPDCKCPVRPF
jgi:hypothetical protein